MQPQSSPTRLIPLSQGLFALVDAEDYPALSRYKWHATRSPKSGSKTAYAVRTIGPKNHRTKLPMHRQVLGLPPSRVPQVDHIDRDGLNNRKSNLRAATQAQQSMDTGLFSNNTSGYRGVTFLKRRNLWNAFIYYERHRYHLGDFQRPEDAAKAYDAAARRYHGAFASLNFPNHADTGAD